MSTQNLIGLRTRLDTEHPQDLVDALYREVFDIHPIDAEVDMVVAFRRPDPNDNAYMEVVDAKLYRVSVEGDAEIGRFRFLATPDDDSWPLSMLKDMVDWGFEVNGRYAYEDRVSFMLLHKHPEGALGVSPKDERFHEALNTIAFARTDFPDDFGKPDATSPVPVRVYQGMAIINRRESIPLAPGTPTPGIEKAIDLPVLERMNKFARNKHGFGDDHPFVVAGKELEKLLRIELERDLTIEEAIEKVRLAKVQLDEMTKVAPPMPTSLQDIIDLLRRSFDEDDDKPIGFQPPAGPPSKLPDIFRLPSITPNYQAQDHIKRPDDENRKDRLN